MNASSTFYCLLICWVATSAAAADLPVLDTFPRCDYQLVQQFDITEQRSTDEASEPEDQQKLLAQVIHLIRRNSADAGAEAIILQHVDGDKLMLKNSVRRKTGSFELRLNARADAITLCEEDPELPVKATPFNERGNRNAVLNTQSINIPIAFTLNTTSDTGSPGQPLKPLVSLQHGFHGVLPGMTKAELKAIWGQPDAEFQLQPEGYQALAYGKQYWLLLYQDEVVSIDSRHSLLSADITHQLNDNQAFSHLAWQLDGHFCQRRTPLWGDLFGCGRADDQRLFGGSGRQRLPHHHPYAGRRHGGAQLQLPSSGPDRGDEYRRDGRGHAERGGATGRPACAGHRRAGVFCHADSRHLEPDHTGQPDHQRHLDHYHPRQCAARRQQCLGHDLGHSP